jgi:signal peptidase II
MNKKVLIRTIVILFVLALNIGCDQVSKTFIRNKIDPYSEYTFLHRHVIIQRVENPGAFLSLGDTLTGPLKIILLNILPAVALLFGLYFVFTKTNLNRTILFGIILVVGGGAGNLYDRVVHGSVTDFMHINFVIFRTGIFNVADMSIMAGMFLILIHTFFKKKPKEEVGEVSEQAQV